MEVVRSPREAAVEGMVVRVALSLEFFRRRLVEIRSLVVMENPTVVTTVVMAVVVVVTRRMKRTKIMVGSVSTV
jgi:hypothetical protein